MGYFGVVRNESLLHNADSMGKFFVRAWRGFLLASGLSVGLATSHAQIPGAVTAPHSFGSLTHQNTNLDGAQPSSGLTITSDGSFYGTTSNGGPGGSGTVFHFVPGGAFTTLYSFSSADGRTNSDGAIPEGRVIQARDGNFYGTTSHGGSNGVGTVFKLTPEGVFTTLHHFGNSTGATSLAGLVEAPDGNFYGTTYAGGEESGGTVFKITPAGDYTVLREFSFYDDGGAQPAAALLIGNDGKLYGTAAAGGTRGHGTVFSIGTDGTFLALYSFSLGHSPLTPLIQGRDGNLYGSGGGTLYSVTPDGTVTILPSHDAAGNTISLETIVQGSDGSLYGTEYGQGTNDNGLILQRTSDGLVTPLYNFSAAHPLDPIETDLEGNGDGRFPVGGLVQGHDGSFYGTAAYGGNFGEGTVFRLEVPGILQLPSVSLEIAGAGTSKSAPMVAGGAPVKIKVSRTGGDLTQPLTVIYQVKTKAVAGQDYDALSGSVTIPAGSSKAKFPVQALAGSTALGAPIKLQLSPSPNGSYVSGTMPKVKLLVSNAPGQ